MHRTRRGCCPCYLLTGPGALAACAWGLPELAFTSDHAQVSTMNEFLAR